jgi:hypothetical protein
VNRRPSPPIAIGGFSITFAKESAISVSTLAWSMLVGAVALSAYCATCALLVRFQRMPALLGTCLSWSIWGLVTALAYALYLGGSG